MTSNDKVRRAGRPAALQHSLVVSLQSSSPPDPGWMAMPLRIALLKCLLETDHSDHEVYQL